MPMGVVAPTNLTAGTPNATTAAVALSWRDNATTDTGYLVEVSTDGSTWNTLATVARTAAQTTAVGGTVNYTAAGTAGFVNTYRVTAINVTGVVTTASTSITIAVDMTAPAAPTNVVAASGSPTNSALTRNVTVSWTDNSTNETGFNVRRQNCAITRTNLACVDASGNSVGNWSTQWTTGTAPANAVTTNQTGLTKGMYYRYQVQARGVAGSNSAWSATTNPVLTP
jgi:hypothetical protein